MVAKEAAADVFAIEPTVVSAMAMNVGAGVTGEFETGSVEVPEAVESELVEEDVSVVWAGVVAVGSVVGFDVSAFGS